jgi:hypothetical protein
MTSAGRQVSCAATGMFVAGPTTRTLEHAMSNETTAQPAATHEHAAPTPEDLQDALQAVPEGPNIEAGPWELRAAEGQTPLEGPRVGDTDSEGRPLTPEEEIRKAAGDGPR